MVTKPPKGIPPQGVVGDIVEPLKDVTHSDKEEVHLDGLKAFYFLRKKWSWFILGCITVIIIFQITLTWYVGKNDLNFKDYPWFLPLVASENFIQIIGLAIIVVKFLFDRNGKAGQ